MSCEERCQSLATHSDRVIAVIGLGYIGLPTAIVFAATGHEVIGIDTSEHRINLVNEGVLPFVEAGLDVHLERVVASGALRAQRLAPAADVYIVAVPTPLTDGGDIDLGDIDAATDALTAQLRGHEMVILESTSAPGTTERLAQRIRSSRPDLVTNGELTIDIVHCPERVLPGRIVDELVTNDRVIGGLTSRAAERARDLYASFCKGDLLLTDATTAEMAKLTENSFRDVNIAFANELSIICDKLGLDVWELIDLANRHPRVHILQPGPGVGGHCIAVDPWFIVSAAPLEARLIRTAREVNDHKPNWVLERALRHAQSFDKLTIAALGLAFKKNIDDLRESPALDIVMRLSDERPDATVLVVEPNVSELPPALANRRNVDLVELDDALDRADIVLLLVDHDHFADVDAMQLHGKHVVDTRGQWRNKPEGSQLPDNVALIEDLTDFEAEDDGAAS